MRLAQAVCESSRAQKPGSIERLSGFQCVQPTSKPRLSGHASLCSRLLRRSPPIEVRWTIPEISWAGVNQQEAEAQGLNFGVVQAWVVGGVDQSRREWWVLASGLTVCESEVVKCYISDGR